MERTITPTELAAELGGPEQNHSRSPLARQLREWARHYFAHPWNDPWHFTETQADLLRLRYEVEQLRDEVELLRRRPAA